MIPADDIDHPIPRGERRKLQRNLSLIIIVLCVGTSIDLIFDRPETFWSAHVLFELGLLTFGLGSVLFLWLRWREVDEKLVASAAALAVRGQEKDVWRGRAEKLLRGLGAEIDAQFQRWELTPAESRTALFILKGYGHKEIAVLQSRSERTVRQHAIAVYRKSGLSNRAELAAFFLEDLLLPPRESVAETTGNT